MNYSLAETRVNGGNAKKTGKAEKAKKANNPAFYDDPDIICETKGKKNIPLPFEKTKEPKDWTNDERMAWIEAYDHIIRSAINPFSELTKMSYLDMDDLYQSSLVIVLNSFDKYDASKNTKLTTYIYRAIKNELISKHRFVNSKKRKGDIFIMALTHQDDDKDDYKKKSNVISDVNSDFSKSDTLHTYAASVDTCVQNRILLQQIYGILSDRRNFCEADMDIFLRCVSGESQLDVAADYGIQQATVCGITRRVRAKLYAYMERSKMIEKDELVVS